MGKAEERRAAIVAQQAAREAAEREARRLAAPPAPARKPRPTWSGGALRRGRPPRPEE